MDEINPEDMPLEISLIDGGGGGGKFFTEVTTVPSGRNFSIPTDYDKVVILLQLEPDIPTSLGCSMGYNHLVKNQGGVVAWLSHGTVIFIDNVNMRVAHTGYDTAVRTGNFAPTERVASIQPHWLNSSYAVTGGYWTIPIE